LIPSPIHKALLTFRSSNVRFLLMGGQACVLYGAAEFSRDLDLSIAVDAGNLAAVKRALSHLKAKRVFAPPLDAAALKRGHACHFRCAAKGAEGLRIDLMAAMRGCPDFDVLWERRLVVELPDVGEVGVLCLPDLVAAKKTQREKDWPMIRRLIEADIFQNVENARRDQIVFWLKECRTPELLVLLARKFPEECKEGLKQRPLIRCLIEGKPGDLEPRLKEEQTREIEADREYWRPLRNELEQWRRELRKERRQPGS